MKKLLLTLTAITILFTAFESCKKKDNVDPNNTGSYDPIIPSTGGWFKVGMAKYTYTTVGFKNQNSMKPAEIQKAGDELFILYSEDYRLSGVEGHQFYKGRFRPGSNDTVATTRLAFSSGTDRHSPSGLTIPKLIPGSFGAIGLRFYSNPSPYDYLAILDESSNVMSSQLIRHPSTNAIIYSNGDVMAGAIDYSGYAEMDFYNKATNSWTVVKGTSHDTTALVDYTPFRLTDGTLCAFNVTSKNGKTYIAIANPVPSATYPTPLYHSMFLQEIPALAYDAFADVAPFILGSTQVGNTFTVVLGTAPPGSSGLGKIHAYKWTQGDAAFTELYSGVSVSGDDATELLKKDMKCRPDGILYKWQHGITGLYGDIFYADRLGTHRTGNISYPHNVLVGAITYIEGAYYMGAYFISDQYDTDHKMRMDIIKFVHD